jgi:hypothetical protein
MLLVRSGMSAIEAVEHLVGMQAQAPLAPYVGLWARLQDFHPEELAQLITDRRAVRTSLMRTTLHLVSAADCLALRPLMQPVLERGFRTGSPYFRQIADIDLMALLEVGRAILAEVPQTTSALGTLLQERWPTYDAVSMAHAVRYLIPLVQMPPRGIWGKGGQATWTTVEQWLARPVPGDGDVDAMVLRYLGAFGPATVQDVQAWCWLTRLRPVVERLRPQLRTFRDVQGSELFDLPDAPRPDPETPAPPRFVPEYDNVLLSHADRTRVIADAHRDRVFTKGSCLVDGFVCGAWKIVQKRDAATLTVELFAPLSTPDREALEEEGAHLLDFAARAASRLDIQFVQPD